MQQQHTTDTIPTQPTTLVRIDLGDGCPLIGPAGEFSWGPGLGPEGEGRIQGYEVLDVPQRLLRAAHRASARLGRIPVACYVRRDADGFAQ